MTLLYGYTQLLTQAVAEGAESSKGKPLFVSLEVIVADSFDVENAQGNCDLWRHLATDRRVWVGWVLS